MAAHMLETVALPEGTQIMAVMRDGAPQPLLPQLELKPGDYVYLLAQPKLVPDVNKLFDPHRAPERLEEHLYFGDFVLNGEALLSDLAEVYGLQVPAEESAKTLAEYLAA